MKKNPREITLKYETLKDITSNNIDTNLYIERINRYLSKANNILNKKLEKLDPIELYNTLSEIYEFEFEPKDYLKMLSLKNNKQYNRFININTRMYDENNYNLSYLCAATNEIEYEDNTTLKLKKIKKLTDSKDLLIVKPCFKKVDKKSKKIDKFERLPFDYININSKSIYENDKLFPYALDIFRKEIVLKFVYYDVKAYINEVLHQAKEIRNLSKSEDKVIASIGKQYKDAYDKATNNGEIHKKEKISYNQKSKKKKNK